MHKIFIINGGTEFAHSGAKLNHTITEWAQEFFNSEHGFEVKITHINEGNYNLQQEVEKFVWADTIIYHFPVWWFHMPYTLKEYLDKVLTAGHRKGMYYSDGRKSDQPEINYGTGGLMHGRKYMVITTWNAPATAFILPGEFFQQKSVDEGVLFPFHRMNAFLGLQPVPGIHFHDVEKNVTPERVASFRKEYLLHLKNTFINKNINKINYEQTI